MNLTTPKYFHYFLVALAFDLVMIIGYLMWRDRIEPALFVGGIWALANFINYPRITSRRYISYYNLIALSLRQLITFYFIYGLYYTFLSDSFPIIEPLETLAVFIILLSRIIYVFVLRQYRKLGKGYNRFLIIGDTILMQQLKDRFLQKKSYGYVHEGTLPELNIEAVKDKIIQRHLNEIYCSSVCVNQEEISALLSLSFQFGTKIHVITDNKEHPEDASFGNLPIDLDENGLENYPLMDEKNLIMKRIFDFFFSLFVCVFVLSWVTPLLGLIILIESRGSVFFSQPRAGRNGRYFKCIKFRSMHKFADQKQASRNDPRVTKVGRFIRKTSIDELPQFWNVLIGQMSVVGPRPHVKQLNDKYDNSIANYTDRILVKPGITGLSQISGFRGETEGNNSMKDRIKTDIIYLRKWTLYLDVVIIYRTVIEILSNSNENAY